MAISEPVRNGKPDAGGVRDRDRERDRERERERDSNTREREREREWVPRESAQQQQHHRERDRAEREPPAAPPLAVHPRDLPLSGANAIVASSSSVNALPLPPPPPPPLPLPSPLAEMPAGSSSSGGGGGNNSFLLSRIGGPYRSSPPSASNSFRSDGPVGEQRSWPPEDDWDGATRKRSLAGEHPPSFIPIPCTNTLTG